MNEYGLDAMALVRAVERLLDSPLQLTSDDLSAIRLETCRTADKTEDL
jgi:transketolase